MNDFYSPTKIFSTVTELQRCHQEHFGGSQKTYTVLSGNKILCSLVFCDSYPSLGHVISRTWPIKVPLIDISGYTEKFACLRCEQGCKNKRLVVNNIFSHSVSRALCKNLICAAFLICWITSGWLSSPINYCYIVNLSFPLKSVNVSFSTNFGIMQGHFLMPCVPYLTVCILFIFVIINFQVSHKLVLPLNRVMVLRPLSSKDMDLLMLLLRVRASFKCFLTIP